MATKYFKQIFGFFRDNRKRLMLLTLLSMSIYGMMFATSYLTNPEKAFIDYSLRYGFAVNMLASIFELVVTFYILIYLVFLPLMHRRRKTRPIIIGLLLYTVKLGSTFLFYYEENLSKSTYTDGVYQGSAIVENSINWLLIWHIMFYAFELAVSFSGALMADYIRKGRDRVLLEKQKAEAELSVLKYQINPHFLFNSLSFIYNKTIKLDESAAQSVLILADIMRYVLKKEENEDGKVQLGREIDHMNNVIEINQLRYDRKLNIQFVENVANRAAYIIPLVLITLLENAFKHGDLLDEKTPLEMTLTTTDSELSFFIKNRKGRGKKDLSNGIGLPNIKQQLQLMYGNKHQLSLSDQEETFSVTLQIPLSYD